MRVHRPLRVAAAALVTIAIGIGASTGVAGAQTVPPLPPREDPTAFCAGVAALDDLDAMFTGTGMGDLATARATVGALAARLQQLIAVAPAAIIDEVALVSSVFDEFAAEIDAIDPAGTTEEQAAAVQAALETFLANAPALEAAGTAIDAFITANCAPVGGVAAGFGGTASGSSGSLAEQAAPFAAVVALGAAAAAVVRRRRQLALA